MIFLLWTGFISEIFAVDPLTGLFKEFLLLSELILVYSFFFLLNLSLYLKFLLLSTNLAPFLVPTFVLDSPLMTHSTLINHWWLTVFGDTKSSINLTKFCYFLHKSIAFLTPFAVHQTIHIRTPLVFSKAFEIKGLIWTKQLERFGNDSLSVKEYVSEFFSEFVIFLKGRRL